jgi:hypothetical protein
VTHNLVANWSYHVAPEHFSSTLVKQLLGGWDVAGIVRARSGGPLEVTQTSTNPTRPDLVGDIGDAVNGACCSPGSLQYLNPASFKLVPLVPASGAGARPGTLPHNALRGPSYFVFDLSLGRQVGLPGRSAVQLRVDILNALNHTNYGSIRTSLNSVDFGRALSIAGTPRKVQLQARLTF